VGILWRLFAPKPLKKARRSVRKVAHPVRTVTHAVTPKPIRQVRHALGTVAHPIESAEFAIENRVVHALNGTGKGAATTKRHDGLPARFTDQWIRRTMPRLNPEQTAHAVAVMRQRGWTDDDLRRRVYPYVRKG